MPTPTGDYRIVSVYYKCVDALKASDFDRPFLCIPTSVSANAKNVKVIEQRITAIDYQAMQRISKYCHSQSEREKATKELEEGITDSLKEGAYEGELTIYV